jgi:hypothetical protein
MFLIVNLKCTYAAVISVSSGYFFISVQDYSDVTKTHNVKQVVKTGLFFILICP